MTAITNNLDPIQFLIESANLHVN